MTIGQRLAIFLQEKGMTQKAFSKRIDYREQSISHLINGQTKNPRTDLIVRTIQSFPELNLKWLLLGEGEMFSDESVDTELQTENMELRKELILAQEKIIKLLEEK